MILNDSQIARIAAASRAPVSRGICSSNRRIHAFFAARGGGDAILAIYVDGFQTAGALQLGDLFVHAPNRRQAPRRKPRRGSAARRPPPAIASSTRRPIRRDRHHGGLQGRQRAAAAAATRSASPARRHAPARLRRNRHPPRSRPLAQSPDLHNTPRPAPSAPPDRDEERRCRRPGPFMRSMTILLC